MTFHKRKIREGNTRAGMHGYVSHTNWKSLVIKYVPLFRFKVYISRVVYGQAIKIGINFRMYYTPERRRHFQSKNNSFLHQTSSIFCAQLSSLRLSAQQNCIDALNINVTLPVCSFKSRCCCYHFFDTPTNAGLMVRPWRV